MKMERDPQLFSEQRVKEEFWRALDFCLDPEQQRVYLNEVGYYGRVGDGKGMISMQGAKEYIHSMQDQHKLDQMYRLALQYFTRHYAQPMSTTQDMKTVDGASSVLLRPMTDSRMLEIGRVGSASDAHYVLRACLYGFDTRYLGQWPLGGIYVRKCCGDCGSTNSRVLIPCVGCGDVFYCSADCQKTARPFHAGYCVKSSLSQGKIHAF